MLALMQGQSFISSVEENSLLRVPHEGAFIHASPALAGWTFADYRLVPAPDIPETPEGKYISKSELVLNSGELAWEITYEDMPTITSVPESISDRQFFQVLANRGLISRQEAIAAVSVGTLPAAMEAMVVELDEEAEFKARMLLQGATQFYRSNALIEVFAAGFNMTPADIDQLWIDADKL